MIKNLKELELSLGLKEGEFKTLYDDAAEKEINLADLEIVKKDEYTTRIANVKKEAGIAAVEIAIKDTRTKLGLEFTGKTVDNLLDAFKTKTLADAKIEPDKKVAELTTDLGKMKANYEQALSEKNNLETTFKQKENSRKINFAIINSLPKDLILSSEDAAELTLKKAMAAGITPDISENGDVIYKKGEEILKDKNLVPLKGNDVLKDYFQSFIKPTTGGAGGGDNAGQGKPGTFEAFDKEMSDKGVNREEYNREMQKRIKEKTLTL